MMRLQGVDRPAIIFEILNKGPNQSAPANRRPTEQSDGSLALSR
jgi:hypothetical protein